MGFTIQSSLDIIASMLDLDVEIHIQKFADLSPLLMEQELQAISLQEEQIELINKIERKITLCALQKAQNGEVINVKKHVEKISAYIYKLNRKQIKEVDHGLGQIVDLQNAVGDFTITPTAFPMTAQCVLHFLVTTFGSYLVTKAIVDTQDALNKHQSDPEDRLNKTQFCAEFSSSDNSILTLFKKSKKDKESSKHSEADKEREKNKAKGISESALGPSGKPKIHIPEHPTKKRAEDAAVDSGVRGKPPEHHVNPVEGDPHFHPSGSNSREHHSYPGHTQKYHPPKKRDY